jgi:hypothetical protein
MNLNLEINKKLIAVILAIGSLTLTLAGVLIDGYIQDLNSAKDDVLGLRIEVEKVKQKVDDDKSQWLTLKQQDDKLREQEIEIGVLKLMLKNMSGKSQCQEIVVRLEESEYGAKTFSKPPPAETKDPPKPKPIPDPQPNIKPPALTGEEQKIFEDLEKKLDQLERKDDYQDFRREQMIRQKRFDDFGDDAY